MTPLGYYKWFPRDFMSSTTVRRMSVTAKGVYRELLDLQWEDGSVPTDPDEAREIIGATCEEWALFAKFFETCFPGGINPQLNEQRAKSVNAIELQREAGRKGGTANGKGRPKQIEPKPEANDESNQSEPLTQPLAVVRGTPNPTTTETETTNEQEFVSAGERDFSKLGFEALKQIPAVASCNGVPEAKSIEFLVQAATRQGFDVDAEFVDWCGWIAAKASGIAYFTGGTNNKSAAAIFDQFAPDIRKEQARRRVLEPSAKTYDDPLQSAVSEVFESFKAHGGKVGKDATVEAYAAVLRDERFEPSDIKKHGLTALRGVTFLPPAFGLADLLRPLMPKPDAKPVESEDPNDPDVKARHEARYEFNRQQYQTESFQARIKAVRDRWQREEVPA